MLKIKKVIIGILLSVVLTTGLLALFSVFVVKMGVLPGTVSGTLSMAAGAVSILAAAVLTARWAGERGLIHGAVLAGIYSAIYILLSIAVCEAVSPSLLIIRTVIFLLSGTLGGIIGVSGKNKIQF